jgi:hypothetical protein
VRLSLIAAMLIALSAPAHAECLSSAKAVWSAHPGSHATWRLRLPGHIGEKCWFLASKSKVMDADASRGAGHEIRPVSATAVPIPRPRSQGAPADTERGSLSILIWGRADADRSDVGRDIRGAGAWCQVMPISSRPRRDAPSRRKPLAPSVPRRAAGTNAAKR